MGSAHSGGAGPGRADEYTAGARVVRDVAGSACGDAGRRVAGGADRKPRRPHHSAYRRRRIAVPRFARGRLWRACGGAPRVWGGLRRDQRISECARPSARTKVRALDPLVVSRVLQRWRSRGRRPRCDRRRSGDCTADAFRSARPRARGSGSCDGALVAAPRWRPALAGPDPRPPTSGPAPARRGNLLHDAGRGSRRGLERRLPLGLPGCGRRCGRARVHRLLTRDGDEPLRRRSPERALRASEHSREPAACSRRPASRWRSSSAQLLQRWRVS